MFTLNTFLLIRLLLGLAIGILIAFKLKDFIRAAVLRFTPMHRRLSPSSLNTQTRITTLIAVILIIAITALSNFGMTRLIQKIGWEASSIPLIPHRGNHNNNSTKEENPRTSPTFYTTETSLGIDELEIFPPQKKGIDESSISRPENNNTANTKSSTSDFSEKFFIQIYAFDDFSAAKEQQLVWTRKTRFQLFIGRTEEVVAPYKVLLGPFVNRHIAEQYMHKKGIKGFVRAGMEISFFGL